MNLNNIKSKLSNRQKMLPRFFYNIFYKKLSFQKSYNWLKYDWNVLNSSEINFIPPIFIATITEACNLRCPTCLYVLEDKKYLSRGFLKIEDLKFILDKYKAKKADIIFLTGGEPLLHPEIKDIIKLCKLYKLIVKISTNGILIKDKIEQIKDIDEMNISLDCYDYVSYQKNRGGTNEQYVKLIKSFDEISYSDIKAHYSFLLHKGNVFQIEEMLEFAESFSPSQVTFHNINPHGTKEFYSLTKDSKKEIGYIESIMKRDDYPFDIVISQIFDINSDEFRYSRCIQPWYYFCFNSRGDIAECCHLPHRRNIGNVSYNYDFNSRYMINFRNMMMKYELTWVPNLPKSCIYCQRRFIGKNFAIFNKDKKKWII